MKEKAYEGYLLRSNLQHLHNYYQLLISRILGEKYSVKL